MTSSLSFDYLCKRGTEDGGSRSGDGIGDRNLYCAPLHTPTILCIDGVAALVRGDIEDSSK